MIHLLKDLQKAYFTECYQNDMADTKLTYLAIKYQQPSSRYISLYDCLRHVLAIEETHDVCFYVQTVGVILTSSRNNQLLSSANGINESALCANNV